VSKPKTVRAEVAIDLSLAEVWETYFDPGGWPEWVDGFETVTSMSGYPLSGGELNWRSIPAGRGAVREEVVEHEPRRLHRVRFSDDHSEGTLTTTFEMKGGGVLVVQELSYRLTRPGLFGVFTDALFVRGQMRASLERSLERLRGEAVARTG
jgi:uncharacterized protein YndB with AHSA1/START domain